MKNFLDNFKYYISYIKNFFKIRYQIHINMDNDFPNWYSEEYNLWVDTCFRGSVCSNRNYKGRRKAFKDFKKLSKLGIDCRLSKVVRTYQNIGSYFIDWESKDQKYFGKDLKEKKKRFDFNVLKKIKVFNRLRQVKGKYYIHILEDENNFPNWWNRDYKIWTDLCCSGDKSSDKLCKSKRKAFKEFDKLTEMGITCRLEKHWFPLGYNKRWIQEWHSKDQKWFGEKIEDRWNL